MADSIPITSRQQQALDRQQQILDTALSLFAAHGYAATSTKQIAREIGIAEGLIFHYFPKKLDLLKALLNERHAFIAEMVKNLITDEQQTIADELSHVARHWLNIHRQEQKLVTILLRESHSNPEVQGVFVEVMYAAVQHFEHYLQSRMQQGDLRTDLPLHTMAMNFFGSLLLFFFSNQHLTEDEWNSKIDDFISSTVEQWLHGVKAMT